VINYCSCLKVDITVLCFCRVSSDVPAVVNSAVFSLSVINGTSLNRVRVTEPVTFHFRQLQSAGRSSPRCVSWTQLEG